MSHNHDLIAALNELTQRVGFHTGLHTGGLLHLLGLAAKIGDLLALPDNNLIAAAGQRQINSNPRKLVILRKGLAGTAEAHT